MELCCCYSYNAHLFTPKSSANLKANPSPAKRSKYSGQSIRAIPIRILTIGKKRSPGIQLTVEEYKEKLKYYCNFEDILIKSNPKTTSDVKAQIEAEDTAMMQHIKPEDWVVMLDENGRDITSEQMADLLGDSGKTGSSRLTFCIGGPYGHGPLVRERADVAIRLSSLVLNHQVALVVLAEQLYRTRARRDDIVKSRRHGSRNQQVEKSRGKVEKTTSYDNEIKIFLMDGSFTGNYLDRPSQRNV